MHNFIESSICMGSEGIGAPKHSTQKPLKVLRHILKIASNKGNVVLDPFMGVDSTGVATLEMDRKFIGFELDENYFKATESRLKNIPKQLFVSEFMD